MKTRATHAIVLCLGLFGTLTGCITKVDVNSQHSVGAAATWTRSELFFGMNRVDGALVTDAEWSAFVDQEIAPRFPAGLTVHTTAGQYRDAKGVIQRERSRVLVVFYPADAKAQADRDLHAIVKKYVTQFNQESVLRTDSPANVSFEGAEK